MTANDSSSLPGLDAIDLSRVAAVWNAPDAKLLTLAKAGGLDPLHDFRHKDFRGWPLAGHDVRGIDFTGSDLRGTGIERAIRDKTTILIDAIIDLPFYDGTRGKGLFIGDFSFDLSVLIDRIPTGDERVVGEDFATSFGGHAVIAAFCFAKLGAETELLSALAEDWLGRTFLDMAAKYGIGVHGRSVKESSISLVLPNHSTNRVIGCYDNHYLHPPPYLDLTNCRILFLDGEQADAAVHYAKVCRENAVLTSLHAGETGSNTNELLSYIDVAVVTKQFCKQMKLDERGALEFLKSKRCRIGGVILDDLGFLWYDESGSSQVHPALVFPINEFVDTNGMNGVFCGAYLYSYLSNPTGDWEKHFAFGRAAAAHRTKHLGVEAGLPTLAEIDAAQSVLVAAL